MIIKKYMIPVYALLVAGGSWSLEDSESQKVVPEEYRSYVAEYLAEKQNIL